MPEGWLVERHQVMSRAFFFLNVNSILKLSKLESFRTYYMLMFSTKPKSNTPSKFGRRFGRGSSPTPHRLLYLSAEVGGAGARMSGKFIVSPVGRPVRRPPTKTGDCLNSHPWGAGSQPRVRRTPDSGRVVLRSPGSPHRPPAGLYHVGIRGGV